MCTEENDPVMRMERITLQLALSLQEIPGAQYDRVLELWTDSLVAEYRGDLALAVHRHERVMGEVPDFYLVYVRAGRLHFKIGAYEDALAFYEKAATFSPSLKSVRAGAIKCRRAIGNANDVGIILSQGSTNFLGGRDGY